MKHNEPESEDGESLEKAVTTQVGQGSSKEDMTTLIKRLIQEQFQLSQIGQSGSGLNDLAPQIPMNVDIDDHQPMSGETSYSKSDQSSPISQQLLLGKVPKKKLEKANKLLQAFEDDPNTVTWNSDGIVFINGSSLAGSNIFLLMPELFKLSPNKRLPGFLELVSEIASLGLGHLISKKILKGLQRSQPIANQKNIYEDLKKSDHWWCGCGNSEWCD